jgi:hypothetical protein
MWEEREKKLWNYFSKSDEAQHNSELFYLPTKCVFTFGPEKINMILELEFEDIFFVYCILFWGRTDCIS